MHTHKYIFMYLSTHVYIYMYIHRCMYMYVHIYTYTYISVYPYMYTCIYIYPDLYEIRVLPLLRIVIQEGVGAQFNSTVSRVVRGLVVLSG